MAMSIMPSVGVDELAAAMIDAALNGADSQTLENNALRMRGRQVLDTLK